MLPVLIEALRVLWQENKNGVIRGLYAESRTLVYPMAPQPSLTTGRAAACPPSTQPAQVKGEVCNAACSPLLFLLCVHGIEL